MATPHGPFFKRNYILGTITGAFINIGMAFLDPVTVMPVFITKLGGSAALVGLVSALHGVGWFLPQIFASRLAATRPHLLSMYRVLAVARVVVLAVGVLSIFYIDHARLSLFVAVFVLSVFFDAPTRRPLGCAGAGNN